MLGPEGAEGRPSIKIEVGLGKGTKVYSSILDGFRAKSRSVVIPDASFGDKTQRARLRIFVWTWI